MGFYYVQSSGTGPTGTRGHHVTRRVDTALDHDGGLAKRLLSTEVAGTAEIYALDSAMKPDFVQTFNSVRRQVCNVSKPRIRKVASPKVFSTVT